MSKKVVNGVEVSDDIPVTEYDGKFAGNFELDVEKAASMAYDDTVYFVVTTRLDNYAFKPTKYGDLKRVNTFKVDSVRVVKPHELNKMHQSAPQPTEQIELTDVPFTSNGHSVVDGNGEIHEPEEEEIYTPPVARPWEDEESNDNGRQYADPLLRSFLEV